MHVLRVYLRSGQLIEMIYRSEETMAHSILLIGGVDVEFSDDFGKRLFVKERDIAAYQASDYDLELEGAMEINNRKQGIAERLQQRAMQRAQLIGGAANGRIISG